MGPADPLAQRRQARALRFSSFAVLMCGVACGGLLVGAAFTEARRRTVLAADIWFLDTLWCAARAAWLVVPLALGAGWIASLLSGGNRPLIGITVFTVAAAILPALLTWISRLVINS